jgi:hypothetical protein
MKSYFIALSKNWEAFALLGCYALYFGSLPTFQDSLSDPGSSSQRRMQGSRLIRIIQVVVWAVIGSRGGEGASQVAEA